MVVKLNKVINDKCIQLKSIDKLLNNQTLKLNQLCKEISERTTYSIEEVAYMISRDFQNNLSLNDIKEKYKV
jgi:YesN/AraC family two-component response regulator